ncbi:MAG: hypothetical protein J5738_02810 [Lachnospiraceae bacterium]|nr:hypothetical protein [Lachnospiraceae bacterium]
MKRRKNIVVLLLVGVLLYIIAGCGKEEKSLESIYDNSDAVHIDVKAESFGFEIVILSKEKVQSLTLVSYSGKNLDYANTKTTCINNSLEIYRNYRYKGFYCSNWMLEFTFPSNSNIEIDSVTLGIDGEKRVLTFAQPIRYSNSADYKYIINDELYAMTFPNEFSSSALKGNGRYHYLFGAARDCVVKGINTSGNVKIVNPYFSVNDIPVSLGNDGIALKAGDQLSIELSLQGDGADEYSYCISDFIVTYEVDGVERKSSAALVFNPLSPMDDELNNLKLFVDHKLNEVSK